MVKAIGCTAPAPTPWISRNTIIDGMDQAMPANSDPTMKMAMPTSMTGLRP